LLNSIEEKIQELTTSTNKAGEIVAVEIVEQETKLVQQA
jgi:hypothetical protein